jgi:ribosome-binding protein aMBF1 (putative translation factor)
MLSVYARLLALPDLRDDERTYCERKVAELRRAQYQQVAVNARGNRLGDDHPAAKLTQAQVDQLLTSYEEGQQMTQRERRAAGLSQRQLAASYGIAHGTVSDYVSARRRAEIPDRYVSKTRRVKGQGAFTAEHRDWSPVPN